MSRPARFDALETSACDEFEKVAQGMSVALNLPSLDLALEGPVRLATAGLPIGSGIFVILTPLDGTPATYRPLYAGETDNLAGRCRSAVHEAYPYWLAETKQPNDLHIAWIATPMLTQRERQFIVRATIERFDPPCNRAARWVLHPAIAGALRATA